MSEMAFHWAKTKVFAGQCSFQRLWESICVLAFSSSRSHLCPSARGPPPPSAEHLYTSLLL